MTENKEPRVFSVQTRNNIVLDMTMLIAGLASVLTGIYFLFLPTGGFQGGRNPYYGLVIFFERHTWGDLHTWTSVIIMALIALHIPIHWSWIIKMTRSGARALAGKTRLNKVSIINLMINILIGLSGLICGISGLYFLFEPSLVPLGSGSWIFSQFAWDMIHTWSGVALTAMAILHLGIHWRWVVKVLGKYWKVLSVDRLSFSPDTHRKEPVQLPVEEMS